MVSRLLRLSQRAIGKDKDKIYNTTARVVSTAASDLRGDSTAHDAHNLADRPGLFHRLAEVILLGLKVDIDASLLQLILERDDGLLQLLNLLHILLLRRRLVLGNLAPDGFGTSWAEREACSPFSEQSAVALPQSAAQDVRLKQHSSRIRSFRTRSQRIRQTTITKART